MSRHVFADTAFWLALINRHDANHRRALLWDAALAERDVGLLTTEWVLWETLNALSSSLFRELAVRIYRRCHSDSRVRVIPSTDPAPAVELYARRKDKEWSLTDCASFLVMREQGLRSALTSDRHFTQSGFRALLMEDSNAIELGEL